MYLTNKSKTLCQLNEDPVLSNEEKEDDSDEEKEKEKNGEKRKRKRKKDVKRTTVKRLKKKREKNL